MTLQIMAGDCIELMRTLPDNSVDSIVTDPPYGLGFMGKAWDALPPGLEWAEECLRVLKPGGHLLAFGGTRTWHRLAVAVEDAGFELRDSIAWMYGSGFPKSQDVSKAIDKAAGAEREVAGRYSRPDGSAPRNNTTAPKLSGRAYANGVSGGDGNDKEITAPATPEAKQWEGWGTALKPAFEPVVMGRKPFKGTVAANVLEHGTGALNIDGCRIGDGEGVVTFDRAARAQDGNVYDLGTVTGVRPSGKGRFPANVILDEDQAAVLDEQTEGASRFFFVARGKGATLEGCLTNQSDENANTAANTSKRPNPPEDSAPNGAAISGSPDIGKNSIPTAFINEMQSGSRPIETAGTERTPTTENGSSPEPRPVKPSRTDSRALFVENPENGTTRTTQSPSKSFGTAEATTYNDTLSFTVPGELDLSQSRFRYVAKAPKKERPVVDGVAHPTVKPLSLMRYLIRMVTPPGGVVLEPFAGSGTTVEAALMDGFGIIAMERDETYLPLIQARIDRYLATQMEDLI